MKQTTKSSVRDLTTGNPFKLILGFSIPLFFGFLFQQFYSVVDTMLVGRVLGEEALAAVGCTGSVNFLVVGFCMGICSGFAIPVAQKFGARNYSEMRKYVANCVWASAFFALVITVVVSLNTMSILKLMKTPDNIIDGAYTYILIIFIGIPAIILYNSLSGIMRALGDSKTPLIFLIISSVMNIGLDILMMLGFGMGVGGAALATVLSQGISGVLCLLYMRKRFPELRISKDEWKLDMGIIGKLCNMGIPMGLQYSITAIGSVILQSSINTLGSEIVAAVTAASKVSMFFACAFDSMGATMATYGGQNLGARELKRISEGLKSCMLMGIVYSVIAFAVLYFWAADLTGLFVKNPTENMLSFSRYYLLINTSAYVLLAGVNIFRFLIQGLGYSRLAIIAGVMEMIARMLGGIILVPCLGLTGAALSSPLAWLLADVFLIPAYLLIMKRLKIKFFACQ